MKGIMGLMAVILLLNPLASFAQQWELVCEGDNATWYFDNSSVKIMPDDIVQVLARIEVPATTRTAFTEMLVLPCQSSNEQYKGVQGELAYEAELLQFKCNTDEVRTISITYCDNNGKILCFQDKARDKQWAKLLEIKDCTNLLYQKVLVLFFKSN